MLRLGLIGKSITHSKSESIYKKYLTDFSYDLIDIDSVENLPSITDLSKRYDGINITSPYKRHYLSEVIVGSEVKNLKAINCLSFKNEKPYGFNTDFLAINDLFPKYYTSNKLPIFIMGDGVMSELTQLYLQSKGEEYEVLSRKLGSLTPLHNFAEPAFIINTCSREYVFKGQLKSHSVFWDYNYNFMAHDEYFNQISEVNYIDGLSLLDLQAQYAIKSWKSN